MMVSGRKINSMASVLRLGQMELSTRESMSMGKSMEVVFLNGLITPNITVSSTTIIFTGEECTLGPTADGTKESGKTIKCMEKELLFGLMVASTKESTLRIGSKGTENSSGPMVARTRVTGTTESSTEEVCTLHLKAMKNMESGKMERE